MATPSSSAIRYTFIPAALLTTQNHSAGRFFAVSVTQTYPSSGGHLSNLEEGATGLTEN